MNESQLRAGLDAVLTARPFRYPTDAYESAFHYYATKLVVKEDQSQYNIRAEWLEKTLCSKTFPDLSNVGNLLEQIVSVEARDTTPERFEFRQAVLRFLIKQLETNTAQIRWSLHFLGRHCLGFILQEPFLSAQRHELFGRCIQIQDTEGCCDLQVQRMLCDLLQDLQMPPDVWKQQMEATSQIQYQARIDACANIFEQCLTSPSKAALYAQQIAQTVSPADMLEHISIPLCFALYKTCYPIEMAPLEENLQKLKLLPVKSPKISKEFTNLLHICELQPLSPIMRSIDRLADTLTLQPQMNEISIQAYNLQQQQNQDIPVIPQDRILDVLRECNLALNVASERFLIPLSLAIRALLDSADPEAETWRECCSVYLSAWSNAFASQLNRAVYQESALHGLAQRVICFAVFHNPSICAGVSDLETEMQKLCRYYQDRQGAFTKEGNVELVKQLLHIPISLQQ
ncbi:hypothetical protein VTP01DRAFT_10477 [Rhizomucor pusillus]|uniref:uncharacterized protein n=1 Tax=Rhizomucor pusillus TaxID=4840 RepID=UPI0037446C73